MLFGGGVAGDSGLELVFVVYETAGMEVCPNCGEPLPQNAVACRACGSDAETGWRDDVDYYSIEIPEEDDDEVRASLSRRPGWPVKVAVALLVIVVFGGLWGILRRSEGNLRQLLLVVAIVVLVEALYSLGVLKRSFFRKPGDDI